MCIRQMSMVRTADGGYGGHGQMESGSGLSGLQQVTSGSCCNKTKKTVYQIVEKDILVKQLPTSKAEIVCQKSSCGSVGVIMK